LQQQEKPIFIMLSVLVYFGFNAGRFNWFTRTFCSAAPHIHLLVFDPKCPTPSTHPQARGVPWYIPGINEKSVFMGFFVEIRGFKSHHSDYKTA